MKKNRIGILLMVISALFACGGQALWKISVAQEINIVITFLGFLLYAIGALFMIFSYRHGKLSVLQPIQSINYIISLFLGMFLFDEKVTTTRFIGVFIIFVGVCTIARGDEYA